MNSLELASAITALAGAIACNLSTDEALLLASVLVQLGDTLVTIATYDNVCKKTEEP